MPGEKKEEKKKCNYEKRDKYRSYKCSRDALPGDEHCIFHSKDIERKKNDFEYAFSGELKSQRKCDEKYDFCGFVFPGDFLLDDYVFEKETNFDYVQFSGYVSFSEAEFNGKANFWKAQFSGDTYFYKTEFTGYADFGQAQFSGHAYFQDAQFEGVNFMLAKFSGRAYFKDTQFSERAEASFKQTQFSVAEPANFECAKFHGKVDFKDAQFSWNAIFKGAQFSEEAYFNKAKFKEDANFENITIENNSSFKMIDTYFYNVSGLFEYIEENDKVFKKLRKRSKILKTEFLPKNFKLILGNGVTARYPVRSRKIKDDMYLLDKKERISKMHGIRKLRDKTLYFLWWLTADYGRSFWIWAFWSSVIPIVFALIYCFGFYKDYPLNFHTVYINEQYPCLSFLYYSIVTFTTLGFGDIVPNTGWLQFWVAFEVILGYIMLGGLISILANKLARRS